MEDWEKFSFWSKIFWIILALSIVLYFTLQYLIKSKKMKPSKLTRIFYEDDDNFIKRWEKERKKNKFIFFITTIGKFYSIYIIGFLLISGGDLSFILQKWHVFLGALTGCIIGAPIGWAISEDKYIRLIESNSTNNDNLKEN